MKRGKERPLQEPLPAAQGIKKNVVAGKMTIDLNELSGSRQMLAKMVASLMPKGGGRLYQWEDFAFLLAREIGVSRLRRAYRHMVLAPEVVGLLQLYAAKGDERQKKRAKAVLMNSEGRSLLEIALAVQISPDVVRLWLRDFGKHGMEWVTGRDHVVLGIVSRPPASFGLNKESWSVEDVRKVYRRFRRGIIPPRAVVRAMEAQVLEWAGVWKPPEAEGAGESGPAGGLVPQEGAGMGEE